MKNLDVEYGCDSGSPFLVEDPGKEHLDRHKPSQNINHQKVLTKIVSIIFLVTNTSSMPNP